MKKHSFWWEFARSWTISMTTAVTAIFLYLALKAMLLTDGITTISFNSLGEGWFEIIALMIIIILGAYFSAKSVLATTPKQ
jgi:ABC-type nickel/cobalt efflux system permease component RcnA